MRRGRYAGEQARGLLSSDQQHRAIETAFHPFGRTVELHLVALDLVGGVDAHAALSDKHQLMDALSLDPIDEERALLEAQVSAGDIDLDVVDGVPRLGGEGALLQALEDRVGLIGLLGVEGRRGPQTAERRGAAQ